MAATRRRRGDEEEKRLIDLERRGIIRRGRGGIEPRILKPGPSTRGEATSDVLIDERRSDR